MIFQELTDHVNAQQCSSSGEVVLIKDSFEFHVKQYGALGKTLQLVSHNPHETSCHLPNLPMDQTNHLEIHLANRMSMGFAVRVKNGNKLEDLRMAKYMDERNRSRGGMNHGRRYRHHLQ